MQILKNVVGVWKFLHLNPQIGRVDGGGFTIALLDALRFLCKSYLCLEESIEAPVIGTTPSEYKVMIVSIIGDIN